MKMDESFNNTPRDYVKKLDAHKLQFKKSEETFLKEATHIQKTALGSLNLTLEDLKKNRPEAYKLLEFLIVFNNKGIPVDIIKQSHFFASTVVIDELLFKLVKSNLIELQEKKNGQWVIYIHDFIYEFLLQTLNKNLLKKEAQASLAKFLVVPVGEVIRYFHDFPETILQIKHLTQNPEETIYSLKLSIYLLDYYQYVVRDHQKSLILIDQINRHITKENVNRKLWYRYYTNKGDVVSLYSSKDPDKMEQIYKEMIRTLKALEKEEGEEELKIRLYNNISQNLLLRGKVEEAGAFLKKAQHYYDFVISDRNKLQFSYFNTWFLYDSGKYEEALKEVERGVEIAKKEPLTALTIYMYNMKSLTLSELNKPLEAQKEAEKSIELCKNFFQNYRNDTYAESLYALGLAYFKQGHYDKAAQKAKESLAVYDAFYGKDQRHIDKAAVNALLWKIYYKKNQLFEALAALKEMEEEYKEVLTDDCSEYFQELYMYYISTYLKLNDDYQVNKYLEKLKCTRISVEKIKDLQKTLIKRLLY